LVEKPGDWRWSSFRFYIPEETDPLMEGLVDIDPYYFQLGNSSKERQRRYRENIERVIKEDFLKNIRTQLDEGAFGKPDFIQKMKEKFKIRSLRPRGRPKREEK